MVGSRSFRTLVVVLVALIVPPVLAGPAHAARPATVTITSPADGSSGPADLVVAGKATLPTNTSLRLEVSTLGSSIRVLPGTKGGWSVSLSELILGPTTICANVYDGGGAFVTGDCVRYTVLPTPDRFTVSDPVEGSEVTTPLVVTGSCEYGSFVTVTTNTGSEWGTDCDFYTRTWSAPLPGVTEGPVTITATATSLDGSLIATRTVHVTVVPHPAPTVSIDEPVDGAAVTVGQVVPVRGTATDSDVVEVSLEGMGVVAVATAAPDGTWGAEVTPLAPGSLQLCARVSGAGGVGEDCAVLDVGVDPATLGIASPADGFTTYEHQVVVNGSCYDGTTVEVTVADSSQGVVCAGGFEVTATDVPDGTHVVTATMSWDSTVVATRQVTITVDSVAPSAPVITSPSPGATLTSTPITLVGAAEPGARIDVLYPDQMDYASTTADETGAWSATLERDYFEYAGVLTGRHAEVTVYLRAVDAAGNTSLPTGYRYVTRLG